MNRKHIHIDNYETYCLVSVCTPPLLCILLNTVNLLILSGDLIWRISSSGHIYCNLNWQCLVMFSISLMKTMYISGYLIWWFLGPSQISQLKSLPNINHFTLLCDLIAVLEWAAQGRSSVLTVCYSTCRTMRNWTCSVQS